MKYIIGYELHSIRRNGINEGLFDFFKNISSYFKKIKNVKLKDIDIELKAGKKIKDNKNTAENITAKISDIASDSRKDIKEGFDHYITEGIFGPSKSELTEGNVITLYAISRVILFTYATQELLMNINNIYVNGLAEKSGSEDTYVGIELDEIKKAGDELHDKLEKSYGPLDIDKFIKSKGISGDWRKKGSLYVNKYLKKLGIDPMLLYNHIDEMSGSTIGEICAGSVYQSEGSVMEAFKAATIANNEAMDIWANIMYNCANSDSVRFANSFHSDYVGPAEKLARNESTEIAKRMLEDAYADSTVKKNRSGYTEVVRENPSAGIKNNTDSEEPQSQSDQKTKLLKIKSLLDDGIITREEFNSMKKKILDSWV